MCKKKHGKQNLYIIIFYSSCRNKYMEKKKPQRSGSQNKSIHKGCTQIADLLIESGIPLRVVLENLDTRPTMASIKDIFRAIAIEKYPGLKSTSELTTDQVNPVWDDLIEAIAKSTGVHIPFPSRENTQEYLSNYN